jgi:hypothetical protein
MWKKPLVRKSTRFIKLVSPASSYSNIDVASCGSETELCISAVFKIAFMYWKCHIKGIVAKMYQTKKDYLYCCTVHFEDSLSIAHQHMH